MNGKICESFSRLSMIQAAYRVIPLWSLFNAEGFGKLFTKFCVVAFAKESSDDTVNRILDERSEADVAD